MSKVTPWDKILKWKGIEINTNDTSGLDFIKLESKVSLKDIKEFYAAQIEEIWNPPKPNRPGYFVRNTPNSSKIRKLLLRANTNHLCATCGEKYADENLQVAHHTDYMFRSVCASCNNSSRCEWLEVTEGVPVFDMATGKVMYPDPEKLRRNTNKSITETYSDYI